MKDMMSTNNKVTQYLNLSYDISALGNPWHVFICQADTTANATTGASTVWMHNHSRVSMRIDGRRSLETRLVVFSCEAEPSVFESQPKQSSAQVGAIFSFATKTSKRFADDLIYLMWNLPCERCMITLAWIWKNGWRSPMRQLQLQLTRHNLPLKAIRNSFDLRSTCIGHVNPTPWISAKLEAGIHWTFQQPQPQVKGRYSLWWNCCNNHWTVSLWECSSPKQGWETVPTETAVA